MTAAPVLIVSPQHTDADVLSELIAGARSLTDGPIAVLAATDSQAATVDCPTGFDEQSLAAAGATHLVVGSWAQGDARLSATLADIAAEAVKRLDAHLVLIPSSYEGKDCAGCLAMLTGGAAVCDATAVVADGDKIMARKLVLSGSWDTTVTTATNFTPIITVAPGTFSDCAQVASAGLERVDVSDAVVSPAAASVQLVSQEQSAHGDGPELTSARTVVVGGRGVDGDFDLVRGLAQRLGAGVGATRVACDEGWIDRSAQVGQTGVSISPSLYIGLGVSGAVHHTSGIQGAQKIVAICDDSEAPIFEMADFGIVGDVTEVVPQLLEALNEN
ncbi:electron transfer flavoprotein subunit alpha/FixB family protein [Actinomyces vulturis]|uniref:electron transfer flavoprotein subunit alpha/FixB family protein n=1 Tax=Actinomyces vulturis TaxID=1857645 RepID=UPI000832931E|nr:electron transfer flavoprotein subunit alpha/FixB family protein [Actinomyces vulturis]